jgi:hypothetical protein
MDGVIFTGDVSIMTKLMSMSSWVLERSSDEDLQLQTRETSQGFCVATRGLLTMPGKDGAETCRAVYRMEFEMQANCLFNCSMLVNDTLPQHVPGSECFIIAAQEVKKILTLIASSPLLLHDSCAVLLNVHSAMRATCPTYFYFLN